mmetsp:Transcript_7566/g.17802  ORF Transcript_7566/g.17802 Transcript_7566/m.17802 type:complete len:239 (-) Transcript_7566:460-1176(-)
MDLRRNHPSQPPPRRPRSLLLGPDQRRAARGGVDDAPVPARPRWDRPLLLGPRDQLPRHHVPDHDGPPRRLCLRAAALLPGRSRLHARQDRPRLRGLHRGGADSSDQRAVQEPRRPHRSPHHLPAAGSGSGGMPEPVLQDSHPAPACQNAPLPVQGAVRVPAGAGRLARGAAVLPRRRFGGGAALGPHPHGLPGHHWLRRLPHLGDGAGVLVPQQHALPGLRLHRLSHHGSERDARLL